LKATPKAKEPFLLSLHFTAPLAMTGPDDEAESKRIRSLFEPRRRLAEDYAAMVKSLDENIGRVLQALDASGLASNTIVIFTSDTAAGTIL